MNFIEQTLKKKVEDKFKVTFAEYQENVQKEVIEWEKELIEAGMLAIAKKVRE